MGRIDDIFAAARRERRGLIMPFITAGDPSLEVTLRLVAALERAGAAAVEIGFPFSDPIADGPVIAGSMHEALLRGTTPEAIFSAFGGAFGGAFGAVPGADAPRSRVLDGANSATASGRDGTRRMARLAMVSVSIVERMGTASFVAAAAAAGFDGLIVPDADLLASDRLSEACGDADIACAFLVAPTSTPARIAEIVRRCRGFVYLLARAGVTGDAVAANPAAEPTIAPRAIAAASRDPGPDAHTVGRAGGERTTGARSTDRGTASDAPASARPNASPRDVAQATAASALARQVAAIRAANPSLPIAAGFGIATPADVAATLAHVDAAIVGTALVRRIRAAVASGADPVEEAERFVAALEDAARVAAGRLAETP